MDVRQGRIGSFDDNDRKINERFVYTYMRTDDCVTCVRDRLAVILIKVAFRLKREIGLSRRLPPCAAKHERRWLKYRPYNNIIKDPSRLASEISKLWVPNVYDRLRGQFVAAKPIIIYSPAKSHYHGEVNTRHRSSSRRGRARESVAR